MAQVVITIDTEKKEFAASIDGQNVTNAVSAVVFKDKQFDDFHMAISTEEQTENGITTRMTMTAKDTTRGKKLMREGNPADTKLKGFVAVPEEHPVITEAAEFLSAKR